MGSGSGKILLIGSIVKKHLLFIISFLKFLLIRNNRMSVKENQLHNSFKFIYFFFNQNISSTHVKEKTKISDSRFFSDQKSVRKALL